jgi:periplasmic protein TonB
MKGICILFLVFCCVHVKGQPAANKDSAKIVVLKPDSAMSVEIESEFPGGENGWRRYLSNTLVYPDKAVRKKIQGQVVARFIVEVDGSLSNIEIMSGPKELWPAVLDVLNQSPRWHPAFQHGKKVKSYKSQPVNFRLEKQ